MNSYEILKAARTHLCKADRAEVEAAKRIVLPLVRRHWDARVRQATQDILSTLGQHADELPTPGLDAIVNASRVDQDQDRDDLIAALTLSMYLILDRRMRTPADWRALRTIRDAIRGLLRDGAHFVGEEFPLSEARGAVLPTTIENELQLLLHGRIVTRRAEIEALLREALTNRAMRRDPQATLVPRLEGLLGAPAQDWQEPTVDHWAYGAFNLGATAALLSAKVEVIVAWNPKDERTTPFCNWVHGKIISAEAADRKMADYRKAVESDDIAELMKVRPLVSFREGADATEFRKHFRNAVLPPYHVKCRTQARRQVLVF